MARRFTMDVLTLGWLAISVSTVWGCSTGTDNEPMNNGSNNNGSTGSNGSDSGSGGGSGASTGSSSSGSSSGAPSSGSSTGSGSGMAMTGSSGATGAASGEIAEASTPEEASTPGEAAAPTVSFATVYSMVIMNNCGNACHMGASPTGGLNMSSETAAYTNLTTMTSIETGCSEKLVEPNSAMTSLLYQKLMNMQPTPSCGAQMPKGKSPLSSANITLIENWINTGANP